VIGRGTREALTSPALLSQRERREKNKKAGSRSPLSLWERGVRGVRASKTRRLESHGP